ncbi:MAG: bifunctional glutamine amidotransferase/anthranilate phosphoribosyltransferase, partial [Ruminococcus sp.]|nr:bifunctional glutamine amidotransferase/anthranilate phosphoribosyltransferase [Ruminococcus sp.]
LVVYGRDRLDEISISDATGVREIKDGEILAYDITPEEVGLKRGKKEDIVGGNAAENAEITRGILNGSITDSRRDIVLFNAGAGLYVSGKASSIADGVRLAQTAIDDGSAYRQLERLIEFTNRGAGV